MTRPCPPDALQADRIAIVGLGLLGGSIAKALRRSGFAGHLCGIDPDARTLELALDERVIDACAAATPEALFAQTDLVILCQPVGALVDFLQVNGSSIARGRATVVDVGSVKSPVVDVVRGTPAALRVVPCHPIAGRAASGWSAARADLFDGRLCICTPDTTPTAASLQVALGLWHTLGARTASMTAQAHDQAMAALSHLPQVLSFAYLHSLAARGLEPQWLQCQGTGFQGFTRLGASDAALWADIALHNAQPILAEIDRLGAALAQVRRLIQDQQPEALASAFRLAGNFHAQALREAAGSVA